MPTNTQVLLDHRPTDKVSPACFRIVETPVPAPGPGEVLVRHTFLSLDPYMRGRISDAKSYAKPQEVGRGDGRRHGRRRGGLEQSALQGRRRGRRHGRLAALFAERRRDFRVVDAKAIPIQAYLGPARHAGSHRVVRPQQDHRAGKRARRCSSRRRPARSVRWSGQLAKLAGARAVGIAGGPEKCAYAVKELGYAACVDHKSPRFARGAEGRRCPTASTGCSRTSAASHSGRRCGGSTTFPGSRSAASSPPMKARRPRCPDMRVFLVKRIQDGRLHRLRPYGSMAAGDWRTDRPYRPPKRLIWRETIRDGLENAPQALVDLLHGENFGKMLIRVN